MIRSCTCLSVLLAAALAGTPSAASATHLVVVLVDTSKSISDRAAYGAALQAIIDTVRTGDRLIVIPITDATFARAQVAFDQPYPICNGWQDSKLACDRRKRAYRTAATSAAQALLTRAPSQRTTLIEATMLADRLFAQDTGGRTLVMLTDGLESSDAADFGRRTVTPEFTRALIDTQRRNRTLPNLRRAHVYVLGLQAPSLERAVAVQQFWESYLSAANACLDGSHLSPMLILPRSLGARSASCGSGR